jgi:transcriptional regulator with XRE-family HTH domain
VKEPATPDRHAAIGARIRKQRLAKKMRQVDLASKAQMSWRHLIRMERGEGGEPKTETLDRIAKALGVKRSDLTGEDDEEEDDSELPSRDDLLAALRPLGQLFSRERGGDA